MGIFCGIWMIDSNEFSLFVWFFFIGILIIGSGVKEVIILGRWVVFFVLVIIIFILCLCVVWVYEIIFFGVLWVDIIVNLYGILNEFKIFVVVDIIGKFEFDFMIILIGGFDGFVFLEEFVSVVVIFEGRILEMKDGFFLG